MSLEHLNPERGPGETFYGFVENSKDAILLILACIVEKLPRAKRRYTECEKRNIRSGTVIVFHEDESGIRRWTDGKSWSPSRIMGNFLIYRELVDKIPPSKMQEYETPHSSNYALSIQPNDEIQGECGMEGEGVVGPEQRSGEGNGNGNPVLESARFLELTSTNMMGPTLHEPFGRLIQTVTPHHSILSTGSTSAQRKPLPYYKDTFVYHGNKGIFFVKKGGLVKKTFSMRCRDKSIMHLVSYYTEAHLAEKGPLVKTPKDLFNLQDVNFDPEILGNQQFRRTVRLILDGSRVMDLVETVDEAQKSAGGSLFYTTTSPTLPYPVNSLNPLLNLPTEVSSAWDDLPYQDSTSGGHQFTPNGSNGLFGQYVYTDVNYPTAASQGHPLPSWSDSYPKLTGQDVGTQHQHCQDTISLLDPLPPPSPGGNLAPMALANILRPAYPSTTSADYPGSSGASDGGNSELTAHLSHFPIMRSGEAIGVPTPHQVSFGTRTNVSGQTHMPSSSSTVAVAEEEFEYTSDMAHLFHYPLSHYYSHDGDSTPNQSTQPWAPTEGVVPEGRFYPPFFPFTPTGREGGEEGQPSYLLSQPPSAEVHYYHHHVLPQHELSPPVSTPVSLGPMVETSGETFEGTPSNGNRGDVLGEDNPESYGLLHPNEPVVTAIPVSNTLAATQRLSPAHAEPLPSDQGNHVEHVFSGKQPSLPEMEGADGGPTLEPGQEPRPEMVNHQSNPPTCTSTEDTSIYPWYGPDIASNSSSSTTTTFSQDEPLVVQPQFFSNQDGHVNHRILPSHRPITPTTPGEPKNSVSPGFSPGSPSMETPWLSNTTQVPSYHWHATDTSEPVRHHRPYCHATDHGSDGPREQPSFHDTYRYIPPSSPPALDPPVANQESQKPYSLTPCKRAQSTEYNDDDSSKEGEPAPKVFATSPLQPPSVNLLTSSLGHGNRQSLTSVIPRNPTP
ncbi:Global transcription regulator sge1 [Dispira parvispora]|uniref:Global transcription regulator sge1 n=1 Tax=Dispira parvispora TaxID=1520584 RepID=A0A9W8AVQ7_9FUNG|nr:Global transcription regulator sge1 [Dispira parvispora]